MAKNTIKLKNYMPTPVMEEFVATAYTITPGHLVQLESTGKIQKHGNAAGNVLPPMFAVEDELQGRGIDTDYVASSRVQVWTPQRGDVVYALLKDGENVVIGDPLESAGDGTLQKHVPDIDASADATTIYGRAIVGIAVEALDLSASSNTTAGRIQVKIV